MKFKRFKQILGNGFLGLAAYSIAMYDILSALSVFADVNDYSGWGAIALFFLGCGMLFVGLLAICIMGSLIKVVSNKNVKKEAESK